MRSEGGTPEEFGVPRTRRSHDPDTGSVGPEVASLLKAKSAEVEEAGRVNPATRAWKNKLLYGSESVLLPPPPDPACHVVEQEWAQQEGAQQEGVQQEEAHQQLAVAAVECPGKGIATHDDKENGGAGRVKRRGRTTGKPPAGASQWNWSDVIGKVKNRPRSWTGEGGWV